MIVLTAEERAAAKWLKRHGVNVAEPSTPLTARLSPAAVQLGTRRLDRRPPPWREVIGGWYVTSLAITFGGGAVLGIALAAGGALWGVFWLGLVAVAEDRYGELVGEERVAQEHVIAALDRLTPPERYFGVR